jgi:hypothetical protein
MSVLSCLSNESSKFPRSPAPQKRVTVNLLPATVGTAVVDINPSVVTKMSDRGSFQAAALITDAELFLRELVEVLS